MAESRFDAASWPLVHEEMARDDVGERRTDARDEADGKVDMGEGGSGGCQATADDDHATRSPRAVRTRGANPATVVAIGPSWLRYPHGRGWTRRTERPSSLPSPNGAESRCPLVFRREEIAIVTDTPTYTADIRSLFREQDRRAMTFAFDLWDYGDVAGHAAEILERLRDGSMPCDGAWPSERIDLFQRWSESGTPE